MELVVARTCGQNGQVTRGIQRNPARFLACARNTVFLVAMYGPTGSLSRPVGELVQVGQVAADADAGLGCPSGKRRTGRSDISSRFLRAGNVKLTRRLPGGREW